MAKCTPSSVEQDLQSKIAAFKARATAIKEAYASKRKDILDDPRTSDLAKKEDLGKLAEQTRSDLAGIRDEQSSYVSGLRDRIESELRGSQPKDANSIMLRRDAADRARKIATEADALDVLRDAVYGDDDSLADAVGYRARQSGWVEVLDAYQTAHPQSADAAVALAFVEGLSKDPGFNIANQITFSEPAYLSSDAAAAATA